MRQRFSLHNHSLLSDGHDTLEDMLRAGRDAGFSEFGISDHWVLNPNGVVPHWSLSRRNLPRYFRLMNRLKIAFNTAEFSVKAGLEVDYFEENFAEIRQIIDAYKPDYLIGAVHYAGDFPIDSGVSYWKRIGQGRIDAIWHQYWQKYAKMARDGGDFFSFFAHLDLPKKFKFMPSYDYLPEAEMALEAIRKTGKPLEINMAGLDKPCGEPYPSHRLVEMANRMGIPLIISADAHSVTDVARHFRCADCRRVQR